MNQQERDNLRVHWESFRQHRTHFLLLNREQAEQILVWYDELPAFTNDHKQADIAASIEQAIEQHNDGDCDHADWTSNAYSDGIYVDMGYRYCPKCGEKL